MAIFQRIFRIITQQLANVIIILVIALAVAAYWLTNAIDQRQDDIAQWLSQTVSYPVAIGDARLNWSKLSPKLQLHNVTVLAQNQQDELLSLEQLNLDLDVMNSLWQQELILEDSVVKGLKVTVIRNGSGQISLQGLDTQGDSTPVFANLLVNSRVLNSLRLQNITLNYIDQQQMMLSGRYQLIDALIEHDDERWHATGDMTLPPALGNRIKVAADWDNQADDVTKWQWNVKTNGLLTEAFRPYLKWRDITLQQANIDADISGKGQADKLISLSLKLMLADAELVSIQSEEKAKAVQLNQLAGQFTWLRSKDSWQLVAQDLAIDINGSAWPTTEFKIAKNDDGSITGQGGFIRISDVTAVAELSGELPEFLRQAKPAGDIENFRVAYSMESGLQSVSLNLHEGTMLPWQSYPGFTGLTAEIDWQAEQMAVVLASHDLRIYPEAWLEDAVFFDSVTGSFNVQKIQQTWQFQGDALRLWNEDLTLQFDGSVVQETDGKIINDVVLKLEDIAVNQWKRYVPEKILDDGFKEWSKNAFVDGKVINGDIKLQGDLAGFPYQKSAQGAGSFDMALQVEGIQLHYADEWPDLVDVTGSITSAGKDLLIRSQQGTIADFKFADVETRIDKVFEDNPVIYVDGQLKGTTQQALLFLQNSPLKQRFGSVASEVKATGGSDINLTLEIPLDDTDATQVAGDVSFIASNIVKKTQPELGLSNINGLVNFSHLAVSAKAITAQAFDKALAIDVIPKDDKTVIRAKGEIAAQGIGKYLFKDAGQFMSGQTPYQLNVEISEKAVGDFYADVTVQSDLKGLALQLPKPFAKTAAQAITVKAVLDQSENGTAYFVELEGATDINLTTNSAGRQKLSIELATLYADDWLSWSEDYLDTEGDFFAEHDEVVLRADSILAFEQKLTQASLTAKKQKHGWRTVIDSQQSKGLVYLPDTVSAQHKVTVNLDNLNIQLPEQSEQSDVVDKQVSSMDVWPALDLNIATLAINDMNLGQFLLQSTANEQGWFIKSASLKSDIFNASVVDGSWKRTVDGDQTRLAVEAQSGDLAKLLANFDYQQAIEARNVLANFDLTWSGDPLAFSKQAMAGKLNFDIAKGSLKDVEAGAAGRVFGLLSMTAIPRRLSLDFNDLFGQGFDFNSISGTFDIANGQATTENLVLKSEAANIAISGPIDIVNQHYAQKVKIIPNVSSTLPLAGAVAGGPVGLGVGTAILLADKLAGRLFGKEIVNVISYSYDLQGPWQDPQLTIIKPSLR